MKKLVELKRQRETILNSIKDLKNEGKIEEAHEKLDELNDVNREIKVEEAVEEHEKATSEKEGKEIPGAVKVENQTKVDPMVVFNKQVLGRSLSNPEREYVRNIPGSPGQIEHDAERGGVLVPEEQGKQILEYRRSYVQLKDYVNVIRVNTLTGKFPVAKEQDGLLVNFEELTNIPESQILFEQQNWEVKDYGDLIPVSNTLLQDTRVNLINFIGQQFSRKAVNTENAEIVKALKALGGKKVTATKDAIDDIKTALNVTLNPAISANAIILTNQQGFDYLDKLKDTDGRPLLGAIVGDETKKQIKGREVVVVGDDILKNSGQKIPVYIGNFKEAINFYDRMGVEVAMSKEAGFFKNATYLRVIERFDVKAFDKDAVALLEITPTPVA